jgi:DnaD/phage-associated family protein
MAKYRAIYTKIWADPDFQEYEPEVKLLFIYLCTNPYTTESGIYPITLKTISNDIGIGLETVTQRLQNGYVKNIKYDFTNKHIFVRKLRKYNSGGSPALIEKSIQEDFSNSKRCYELWKLFIEEYPKFKGSINLIDETPIVEDINKDNSRISNSRLTLTNGLETVGKPIGENRQSIFSLYESEIEEITTAVADNLRLLQTEYPDEWILEAIKESVKYGKRSYPYIIKILNNWHDHGFKADTRKKITNSKPPKGKSFDEVIEQEKVNHA